MSERNKQGARGRTSLLGTAPRTQRKTMQLCAQAGRAISYALSECHDELLGSLHVEEVQPFPNASRLMVFLRLWHNEDNVPRKQVAERVESIKAMLRLRVAAAINRKRAPDLMVEILMPGEYMVSEPDA